MMRRLPLPSLAVAIAIAALSAGCGNPRECDSGSSCRANPTSEALDATVRARFAPPTGIAPTFVPEATRPQVVIGTPTPELPTQSTTPSRPLGGRPSETPSWTPVDPALVTPRPKDPPFTPKPRPRTPTASEIHLDAAGKYIADVDGCHWAEVSRIEDEAGVALVSLQTSCWPTDMGISYRPRADAVDTWIA